nr:mastin-like [Macaca nemestrina]
MVTLPPRAVVSPLVSEAQKEEQLPGWAGVGSPAGVAVASRGCDLARCPWQVSLKVYSHGSGLGDIAGSLMHQSVRPPPLLQPEELEACAFRVQVGQLRLYEDDQPTKVVEIVRHPRYNKSLSTQGGADIALLKLEAPVPLSELVHPVSLPPASLDMPSGKTCWVTGWGDITHNQPLPPPYHLQEVDVPIVGNSECEEQYQNQSSGSDDRVIQDDMLCAGSEGRDSCQRDSGGPLVCRWNCTWVQVGVVSWGKSCGLRDYPGVYARVTSYVSWIRQCVPPFPRP